MGSPYAGQVYIGRGPLGPRLSILGDLYRIVTSSCLTSPSHSPVALEEKTQNLHCRDFHLLSLVFTCVHLFSLVFTCVLLSFPVFTFSYFFLFPPFSCFLFFLLFSLFSLFLS